MASDCFADDADDQGAEVEIAGGRDPGHGERDPGGQGRDQGDPDQRGHDLGQDHDPAGTGDRDRGLDRVGQDRGRGK